MSWQTERLAAFDVETTGVDTESDRIVTAAVSLVGGGMPTESHAWLIDPGIEIPAEAAAIHGISTEQARAEGRPAAEGVAEIVAVLAEQVRRGVPLVAFNARFDLTILDREARRHDTVPLVDVVDDVLVIDPLVIDKQVDRYRKGRRTLGALCEHYRARLDAAHTANADALAAARVAWRLGQAFPELRNTPLVELHRLQTGWAAEQAWSLQEYFQRQGRDEVVEGAWPMVPASVPIVAYA